MGQSEGGHSWGLAEVGLERGQASYCATQNSSQTLKYHSCLYISPQIFQALLDVGTSETKLNIFRLLLCSFSLNTEASSRVSQPRTFLEVLSCPGRRSRLRFSISGLSSAYPTLFITVS